MHNSLFNMPLIPVKLQRKLVENFKALLILGSRFRPLRSTGMYVYEVMQFIIRKRFASVPGVRAVYVCHSLAAGECYPGLSDFDITIVFDNPDPLVFYPGLRKRWGSLKRYFPINDLSVLTVAEFEEWQNIGGGWDPVEEIRHWRLLAGEELRQVKFSADTEAANLDRMAWALGHFQNLLGIAIKEEQRCTGMALVARRNLHKYFWNTVHATDSKYMSIRTRRGRIDKWIRDRGMPHPIEQLQAMKARQFVDGPVTTLRFEVAAFAYLLLDQSLQDNPILARKLYKPIPQGGSTPIGNHVEVEERARAICEAYREIIEEEVLSVILSATGTARGYSIYVVLRDGLSMCEIAGVLRDIRAIHRVFDDSWFNEHLPAGIPIVCSKAMFFARLQSGRSSLHYFDKFRSVLYGPDLYALATTEPTQEYLPEIKAAQQIDWRREKLLYSLNLHQIYFVGLKPALYDYLTFYLPRVITQSSSGFLPVTAKEAVDHFAQLIDHGQGEIPRRMFEQFEGEDLDYLLKNLDHSAFAESWPVLQKGLYGVLGHP